MERLWCIVGVSLQLLRVNSCLLILFNIFDVFVFWVISSPKFFASSLKEPFPTNSNCINIGNKQSVPQLVSGWIKISHLHILSAGPAADTTYYIWTEDQQIDEIHPFLPSQLRLIFSLFPPSSSPLLSFPRDFWECPCYIFFMRPDMLRGSSKKKHV